MDERILKLIEKNGNMSPEQIAVVLDCGADEVRSAIERMKNDGVILGYKAIIDWERANNEAVIAHISLKVTPQRGEGFDKIAERIYQYPEVKTVYLFSGQYDLGVIIEGAGLKEVALFVAEKLATMDYVNETSTHFVLRRYKEDGHIFGQDMQDERRVITL